MCIRYFQRHRSGKPLATVNLTCRFSLVVAVALGLLAWIVYSPVRTNIVAIEASRAAFTNGAVGMPAHSNVSPVTIGCPALSGECERLQAIRDFYSGDVAMARRLVLDAVALEPGQMNWYWAGIVWREENRAVALAAFRRAGAAGYLAMTARTDFVAGCHERLDLLRLGMDAGLDTGDAWYFRGTLEECSGVPDVARNSYMQASSVASSTWLARLATAEADRLSCQLSRAASGYRWVTEHEPPGDTWADTATPYVRLGQILADQGAASDAVAVYKAGLRLYPDNKWLQAGRSATMAALSGHGSPGSMISGVGRKCV